MKRLIYTVFLLLSFTACEQDVIELQPAEVPPPPPPPCPDDASAGSADFSKFVAIGSSYTAGFQAGALFNEGQTNSLGKILANQFACVGGGPFNQPSINSQQGFNLFHTPNPEGTTVLGRYRLQGTPPLPAPVISGTIETSDALPNPQINPGFMYPGSTDAVPVTELNNFSVPAIFLGQALISETGNWNLAGMDPRFSPFYARFASNAGSSSLIEDAESSVENGGTFVLFWLGMDDALLNAAYGGDDTRAPLTSLAAFQGQFNFALAKIMLENPAVEGVIANYPDPFLMPHFTEVAWNQIPLDATTAAALTANLANNYNAFLDAMAGLSIISAEEAALRKLTYAEGKNAILMTDETLTDLTTSMQGPFAALQPYARARQTKSTDIIPFSTATILGVEVGQGQVLGVSVPVEDEYVLIPAESQKIVTRLGEFNAHIKAVAESEPYAARLAFADVNSGLKSLVTARAGIANGITFTPNIAPPTGIYSEDGLHPNSRGYAFIANIFIDAINAKFSATIPKANLATYGATSLPINP